MICLNNFTDNLIFRTGTRMLSSRYLFFYFFWVVLLWGGLARGSLAAQSVDSLIEAEQYAQAYAPALARCERSRAAGGPAYAYALVQRLKVEYQLVKLPEALATAEEALRVAVAPDSLFFDAWQYRAATLRNMARFEQAEKDLLLCKQQQEQAPIPQPSNLAETWHALGNLYDDLARRTEALEAQQQAINLYERPRDQLLAVIDKAYTLKDLDRIDEAVKLLEAWLARCQRHPRLFGTSYPRALLALGQMQSAKGEAEEALNTMGQAEQLYRDGGQTHRASYGDVLYILGSNSFWTYSNAHRADSIYDRAAAAYRQNFGDSCAQLQWVTLERIFHWQYRHQRPQEWEAVNEAIARLKAIFGPHHPRYAEALNYLAMHYQNTEAPLKALPILEEVSAIVRQAYGPRHPVYADKLSAVGNRLYYSGELKKAEACFLEALDVCVSTLGEGHSQWISILTNLAQLREEQGRLKLADSLRQEVAVYLPSNAKKDDYGLSVLIEAYSLAERGEGQKADSLVIDKLLDLEQRYTRQSRKFAGFLNTLALMKKIQSQYQISDSLYTEYLRLVATFAEPGSPYYLSACNGISSRAGLVLGQPAGNWFEDIQNQAARYFGKDSGMYANTLKDAADYYSQVDSIHRAVALYQEALAIFERTHGYKSIKYRGTKNNLLLKLAELGQYQRAEQMLLEIIDSHHQMGIPVDPKSWNNLGHLREQQGKYTQAIICHRNALDYYVHTLENPQHPDIITDLVNLAYTYLNISKFDSAALLLQQAYTVQRQYPEEQEALIQIIGAEEVLQSYIGNFKQADSLARLATQLARDYYGEGHSVMATRYNNEANSIYKLGRFAAADSLFALARAIEEKVQGKNTLTYATALNNLGEMKWNQARFDEAQILFDSALAIRMALFPDGHPDWASSYTSLASLYSAQGKYTQTLVYAQKAVDVQTQYLGPNNLKSSYPLSWMADAYLNMGRYPQADSIYQRIIDADRKAFGNASVEVAFDLKARANLLRITGQYTQAIDTSLQVLAVFDQIYPHPNHQYAALYHQLANIYRDMKDYPRYDSLQSIVCELDSAFYGTQHPTYGLSLVRRAHTRQLLGDYSTADALLAQGLLILQQVYDPQHPKIAEAFLQQAEFLRLTGQYPQAQQKALLAKAIYAQTSDETAITNILTNLQLGKIYTDGAQFEQADSILKTGIIGLQKLNPTHPRIAEFQLEQVGLYTQLSLYERANATLDSCLALLKQHFPQRHPLVAQALAMRASILIEQQQYEAAQQQLEEVLSIESQLFQPTQPDYLGHQLLLSRCYREQGQYAEARAIHEKTLPLIKQDLRYQFAAYDRLLSEYTELALAQHKPAEALAHLAEQQKLIAQALGQQHPRQAELRYVEAWIRSLLPNQPPAESGRLLLEATETYRAHLLGQFAFLNEAEKIAFLAGREYYFNLGNALCARQNTPELVQAAFNQALFRKSAAMVAAQDFRRIIKQQDDPTLLRDFERMTACQKEIARLEESPQLNQGRIRQLTEEAGGLEASLQGRLPAYAKALEGFRTTWQQVQAALKPGEALLEYIRYTLPGTDSTYYGALMLCPHWDGPRFMPLCSDSTLYRKLQEGRQGEPEAYVNQLYAHDGGQYYAARSGPGSAAPAKPTVSLYRVLWEPLEAWLEGVDTLYYVPEGLLHYLNPAAIQQSATKSLVSLFDFRRLSSARSLVDKQRWGSASDTAGYALIYGDIHYQQLAPTDKEGHPFGYLPFSPDEARGVYGRFVQKGHDAVYKSQMEATEGHFMASFESERKPGYVHVASHGQSIDRSGYIGGRRGGRSALNELSLAAAFADKQPLSRSFIAMAGANDFWNQGLRQDGYDGFLTAYELLAVDMSGVELVVLAACQSGLGDLQDGEGVLGLARALKIAGVRHVVVSLWTIPDAKTQVLMDQFYTLLLDGASMSAPEAFRQAQQQMARSKDKPFDWGSFILLE